MTHLTHTFYQGHHYLKTWPRQEALDALFPENRVIAATLFSVKIAPPIALSSIISQIFWGDPDLLVQVITFVCFTLSLPLQGLYWLGRRSETLLPMNLKSWYYQLQDKIVDAGQEPVKHEGQPRYQELAEVLKQAFQCLKMNP